MNVRVRNILGTWLRNCLLLEDSATWVLRQLTNRSALYWTRNAWSKLTFQSDKKTVMLFLELIKWQDASYVIKGDSLRSWKKSHSAVDKQGRMTLSCYSIHTTQIGHWNHCLGANYFTNFTELSLDLAPRNIHGCGWANLASSRLQLVIHFCSTTVQFWKLEASKVSRCLRFELVFCANMTE
jgi:hypothetical protein